MNFPFYSAFVLEVGVVIISLEVIVERNAIT